MTNPLLSVEELRLSIPTSDEPIELLKGVTFSIYPGEIVGLVGESGCGKSLTASAILGLLPSSYKLSGNIVFEGKTLHSSDLATIRGTRLSLILQDPALALNPVIPIGIQITEGLCYHKKVSKKQAFNKGIEWLHRVGIQDPYARMRQYPHELSGGMKQRILIAMALICNPSLLLADEPTTALDVTVQSQILDILQQLQQEEKTSILLITHDLGVVARCCQRVLVMYAGRIIETGSTAMILTRPQHPYTQALLNSRLSLYQTQNKPLTCLDGTPPSLRENIYGCPFVARCPSAMRICDREYPPINEYAHGNVACWLPKRPRRTP